MPQTSKIKRVKPVILPPPFEDKSHVAATYNTQIFTVYLICFFDAVSVPDLLCKRLKVLGKKCCKIVKEKNILSFFEGVFTGMHLDFAECWFYSNSTFCFDVIQLAGFLDMYSKNSLRTSILKC